MSPARKKEIAPNGPLGWWCYLTREERLLLLAIVLIALIGLTARYVHQRGLEPEPIPLPTAFPATHSY